MRPIGEIVVTIKDIHSLGIDGLPSTERKLRQKIVKEGWPLVFSKTGQYLVLLDAVPEPFGRLIRQRFKPSVEAPSAALPQIVPPVRNAVPIRCQEVMEARLAILFEVFRREAFVSIADALASVAEDASGGRLSAHLQTALRIAVANTHGRYPHYSPNHRPEPLGGVEPTMNIDETLSVSYTTLRRWRDKFSIRGASGLFPNL